MTKYFVEIENGIHEVDVEGSDVRVNGEPVSASLVRIAGTDGWSMIADDRSHHVRATSEGRGAWRLRLGSHSHSVRVVDERTRTIEMMAGVEEGPSGPAPLRAPMPGLVVRIEVSEGEVVQPSQGLAIVEAMKMENELRASVAARVGAIRVAEGQTVEKDEVLIELLALEDEE